MLSKVYDVIYNRICIVPGYLPNVLEHPLLNKTKFDLILFINVLQHLERKEDGVKVLAWMKDHTKRHGIYIVVAFTEGSGDHFKVLLKKNELYNLYSEWKWDILLNKSGLIPKHVDLYHQEALEHYYDIIVARKPIL